jgi:transcriptional regulator with XRE-family HTH domain
MDAFKQPNLGRIIQSLRQEKKLTQEELVEKCNVNVRTLQRIEAGEVTPRDYTIKMILSALDYGFDTFESSLRHKESIKRLQVGWIAGVVYFVLSIVDVTVDFSRFELDLPTYFPFLYILVKAIVATSFSLFMLGFLAIGKTEKSPLLQIAAYLMAGSLIIICIHDSISVFSSISYEDFMGIKGIEAVAFGGIDVLFGIAIFRLASKMGMMAKVAGILEIVLIYKYYDLLTAKE